MNGDSVARATIRIDADTSQAISALRHVSSELNSLVPGGNAVASVFERIQGGFLQLIQGISRNAFRTLSMSMTKLVSSGVEVAKTIEMSRVAFDNLLESGEDVDQLLLKIQEDAVKTPFDVDALTLSTQKIALITKNGSQAERAILNLGKALAAAGRGTAEMNRMATNLQQIGQNAKATERDLREFGNAGVDIVGIVTEFSEEFKESGLQVTEARDWLKSIDKPFEVIVNALNAAGESVDGFAKIYEDGAQTIGQAMENMSDSVGIFSYRVMEQAKVLDRAKNVMKEFQDGLFLNKEFTANAAQAIAHLLRVVQEAKIIQPIIRGIQKVVSAFAAGQFDNVIVFFQNLFNAIKQFSGIKVVSNALKVLFDLFSDNHTAEEVARVAQQIGNLVRVFLELKLMSQVGNYAYNLTNAITTTIQSVQILTHWMFTGAGAVSTFGKASLGAIGAIGALIAAIAVFSNISGENVQNVFESIWSGIKNFVKALGDAASQMLSFGWNLIAGLYNGMVQAFNAVIGKIKEMAQNIINAFAQVFQIHSPSRVMRDYIGRNIVEGIAEGIRENYGSAVVAMEEVMEELVKLQADYAKELGDFGALDLVQQVQVYKMFADLYARGTKARLEMDDKVHDAETSIIKEMIDLIEDFNKAFDSAFKKAKDYYDMFEYTQITLTRTTKSVIEGLRRQNDNMTKYYNNIYRMSQMGFDDDFMAYVYDQGLDAASEVAGLADATAEQIEEINELWRTRGKVATDIAVLNTKKLKEETVAELDYLQTGLDTKALDYYDSGTYLLYNFARGIYDMMPTLEDAFYRVSAETSKAGKAAGDAASEIDTALGNIGLDEVEDFTAAASKMNVPLYDTVDIFSLIKNMLSGLPWWAWAGIGIKAVTGVVQSVSRFKNVLGTAQRTATAASNTIGGGFKRVTEITRDWGSSTDKAAGMFARSGDKMAGTMARTTTEVSNGYKKVVTETQKATRQVNDITYSSATKQGENLLRPFKTFNTRVKGFFSIISNTINEALSVVFGIIQNFVKGVMKVLEEFTKGIGKAIKALLKPLSDPKLFIGVGVLAALAGTLILLATAGLIFNQVDWESLGKLAVVTVGLIAVAAVMGAIGTQAEFILAGALAVAAAGVAIGVATAAIGLGILTLTTCIQKASELGNSIDTTGLEAIENALFYINGMFLEVGILGAAVGAIAGLFSTVVAGELLVIATCLAGASALASGIDISAFDKITEGIKAAGAVFQNAGILGEAVAAVTGIFSTIVAAELFAIALALRGASELGSGINIDNINRIGEAIKAAGGVFLEIGLLGGAWAALTGVFASAVGVEFLAIALALRIASELGGGINLDNLNQVGEGVKKASDIFLEIGLLGGAWAALTGVFASVVGVEFLAIALALRGASELGGGIDLDNLQKVGDGVKKANGIFLEIGAGGAWAGSMIGAFASVVSVELMVIAKALADASIAAKYINLAAIPYIGRAIQLLNAIDFGDFWQNWGNAENSAKVRDVAKNVDEIVTAITDACNKIAELEKISEQSIYVHMAHVGVILDTLVSVDLGTKDANQAKQEASDKLAVVTENVQAIIGTITDAISKLAELTQRVGKNQIDLYMDHIKTILTKLAGFELTDDKAANDNGWFSQTKLDKTKQATGKIAELAEQISKMMGSVKDIVNTLAELEKSGITPTKVETYVGNTKGIIDKFAEIEVTQEVEDSVKDNVAKIAEVSGNVNTIISSAKGIVDTLKGLEDNGISPEKVSEYVGKANAVVAKFGELMLEEKVDGAYQKLADNTTNLATATQNVNKILQQAMEMVNLVEQYEKAIEGKDVDIMVQQINKMLAQIAGGHAYADGESNWHQGIKLPDDMTFKTGDTDILAQVKSALDHIKSIAETINTIPDTAEKIGGVQSIINFINDTMAKLPETLGGYSEEFQGIGQRFADAFKQGWESSYPTLAQAGEAAQAQIWTAIENKMQDEWHQGEWLAQQVINGWTAKVNSDAYNAGHSMQSSIWRGIEDHMSDEWKQGVAISDSVINGIWSKQSSWWWTGDNIVAGIAGGIDRNMYQINRAAGNISDTAVERLRKLLRIASPSKVMAEIGGYVAEGFAEGINDSLSEVEAAGEALANAVMDGYNEAIEPIELTSFEARAAADQAAINGGYSSRSTSVIQNNNIYNNMDMSQALGQIAWEVSRA